MKTTAMFVMGVGMLLAARPGTSADAPSQANQPADDVMKVDGRVLDPAGRPVSGARLYLNPPGEVRADREPRATSDAGGRFRFTFRKSEIAGPGWQEEPWKYAQIVAQAEGFGPDWVDAGELLPGQPVTLNLVEDDVPVEGTIEDLEGRPLAGIIVRPMVVDAPRTGRLDRFIERFRENPFFPPIGGREDFRALLPPFPGAELKTDGQGRFRLSGVGRERLVLLEIEGPNVEHLHIYVATRPGVDFRRVDRSSADYRRGMEGGAPLPVVYSSKFHHLANPSRPIAGTVRERGTDKPIADVLVSAVAIGRAVGANARTDAEGRYRLLGMPSEGRIRVWANRGKGQPYLKQRVERSIDSAGGDAVTVDFQLARGVLMRGRMTDAETGKPVRGSVYYLAFGDNPYLSKVPEIGGDAPSVLTEQDGSYETVGLPGRGVLAARASDDRFTKSRPEQWGEPPDERGLYTTAQMGLLPADGFHRVARIDPKEGTTTLEHDFVLDRGIAMAGKLVDPDGRPVGRASAFGLHVLSFWDDVDGRGLTVTGLERDRPRQVLFLNAERTLGRVITLPGDERGPLTVTLQPCGTLVGRVIDGQGRPRPNVGVSSSVQIGTFGLAHQQARTDADGRFRITGLLPGLSYGLAIDKRSERVDDITVRSGEVKDLGDLRVDNEASR